MKDVTNKLALDVCNFIENTKGIKWNWIANKLGITQQAIRKKLIKTQFTIDDANYILSAIDYKIDYSIKPLD